MRTHKPVSVSLPPELFMAAEARAKKLGFKRATYIQQLILADLKANADVTKTPKGRSAGEEN
jgi:hypothetical protein